ncbi:hypothetical protein GH714_030161 [Hevea brasiliensis]|uniref:Uncharacterized protein n=1 Tax=Hevea brasiliensis TaxID=3981 RepID=A0A6A6NDK2_HEVBR|nr:hypothetical protein GH714_030161 [Hevea brasiliensis]
MWQSGAIPPATLVAFTLNGAGGLDFYDISLVDGYNLPMLVIPKKITEGPCCATGCLIDLNGACPKELKFATRENGQPEIAGNTKGWGTALLVNNTMMYISSKHASRASSSGVVPVQLITGAAYYSGSFAFSATFITLITNIGVDNSSQIVAQMPAEEPSYLHQAVPALRVNALLMD